ncbi:MAG: TIGR02466 family protein [Pseudomonadota bacterium]|nr:TIGR02466 family protein [Pseudomonadota bacterium]
MDIDNLTHHYAVFPTIIQSNFFPRYRDLNSSMLMELDRLGRVVPNSLAPRVTVPHYTTIDSCNDLHRRPIFEALTTFIKKELTVFASKQSIDVNKNGLEINKMWFNIYKKGECIDIHNHPNSNFTGVYFLKASRGSSPIIIKSEIIDNMIALLVDENNEYNSRGKVITAEPGKLVVFNSNVMHSTLPQDIDESRVTISFTALV